MTNIQHFNLAQPVAIPAMTRGIIPARHLKKCTTTSTPVVVIMGDSISTDAPTYTHSEAESLWGRLQRRLCQDNPDRTFSFHNRAIGGATWTNANPATILSATGLPLPSWAGAGSTSWIDEVLSLNPDMVVLHFGMNDAQNIGAQFVKAVIEALRAGSPELDIILITPMVPARNTANVWISGASGQNGRLFNAHYLRGLAIARGFGLIDLGRYQARAVQGIDPCDTHSLAGTATARTLNSGNGYTYTAPITQADPGMKIDFTASAPFWSGTRLRLATSTYGADAPNSYSYAEVYDSAGFLALDMITYTPNGGGAAVDTKTVVSTVATPTSGAQSLMMHFKNEWAVIKLGEASVYEGPCLRLGGSFAPTLRITGAVASTVLTITDYPATYVPILPMLTDYEMWGDPAVSGPTEGGNDLNHPTSRGAAAVIAPLLEAIDFHIPSFSEGATFFPVTQGRSMGIGTAQPLADLHVRKDANGGSYVNVGGRSVMIIEDYDLAMLQLLTGTGGSAGIEMGAVGNPNDGGVIYSQSSGNLTLRADDLDAISVLNPTVASQAGVQILVNRAGVVTLSQVTVGGPDSGGTGFRTLNVPNA